MSLELKIRAAQAAFDELESGVRLGIGTGSTADEFIRILAAAVKDGFEVVGVPTSERSRALCEELGVPLATLEEMPELDITVDGADEIDPALNLIKGGGGALLREKIVAAASKRMVVIADKSKLVPLLGAFPLPIEVNRFGLKATELAIAAAAKGLGLNCDFRLRMTEKQPFVTDGGHLIIDASFGRIRDARALSEALHAIPGVVEHGLFLGLADVAIVAAESGIETITANRH